MLFALLCLLTLAKWSACWSSESRHGFRPPQSHSSEFQENSIKLEGSIMLAESSSTEVKKTTYPPHKWTLVKRYSDSFKLKGASMVNFQGKIILFGGCREDLTCSNSVYAFDKNQEILEEIGALGDKPAPRQGHCVVVYGEEMIVFGGSNEIGVYDDLYVFDMKYVIKN